MIPKTIRTWSEPRPFARQRLREMGKLFPWRLWLPGPLLVIVVPPALGDAPFRRDSPEAWRNLGEAVAKAAVLASMPCLCAGIPLAVPVPVRVTDLGIYRSGWTRWEEVDHGELELLGDGKNSFAPLTLRLQDGGTTRLGIAPDVSLRPLEDALGLQGIPVLRHASSRTS